MIRFWSKVNKDGPVHPVLGTKCWLWTASTDGRYGTFHLDKDHHQAKAHRVSWELAHGPIPCGQCVLHHCDTTLCVNPAHLFLGTQLDNIADRDVKGRQVSRKGSANGNSKLTETLVVAIRAASGKHRDIANLFGITQPTVSSIKRRDLWRHVP